MTLVNEFVQFLKIESITNSRNLWACVRKLRVVITMLANGVDHIYHDGPWIIVDFPLLIWHKLWASLCEGNLLAGSQGHRFVYRVLLSSTMSRMPHIFPLAGQHVLCYGKCADLTYRQMNSKNSKSCRKGLSHCPPFHEDEVHFGPSLSSHKACKDIWNVECSTSLANGF